MVKQRDADPSDTKTILRILAFVVHGLAVGVVALLLWKAPAMALFCLVPGALAASASVPTVKGRPVSLYAAFGLLMGYCFWSLMSAVNLRDILSAIPVLLLAAGAVWLLKAPSWPSFVFCTIVLCLSLGLVAWMLRIAKTTGDFDPDHVRKSAYTTFGILLIGFAHAAVGFAQTQVDRPRQDRRPIRRKKRRGAEDT